MAVIAASAQRVQPGQQITVQVRLQDLRTAIAGVAFTLDYDINALRLVDAQSRRTGPLVPASAVAVWNVMPAQNDFTIQNGRVVLAASSATQWAAANGVLAEFTFAVQAGVTDRYRWPIQLSRVEITENGYDNRLLPDAAIYVVDRDPVPPAFDAAKAGLSQGGFSIELRGEPGVPYQVEVSEDLKSWTPLTILSDSNGLLMIQDPAAASRPQRFYRARQSD
ncbi:MAG: hypothetical protein HYY24_27905 [Verrucomicrobia bacterium]|nr:hypothetical protein [Verrucomicrobiota bacterium]